MRKIGIIDFNIFTLDGTTRSDINVIREFADAGYLVSYFNYRPFTKRQIVDLKRESDSMKHVEFHRVNELPDNLDCDVYFITREKLYSLAPYIKANSDAVVIGELHGPVDMIQRDLFEPYLAYFNCLRVATLSIKKRIEDEFNFDRVYVQNVSVRHFLIEHSEFSSDLRDDGLINLVVRARFAYPKDVESTVRLFSYIVNVLNRKDFRLFLTGYGPDKKILERIIESDNLAQYVFFTKDIPQKHLYISTSQLETLGYSIGEEFAQGHPVIAYAGDDGVIRENFADFRDCIWIDKTPETDAPRVVEFALKEHLVEDYAHNLRLIAEWRQDYVQKFEANIAEFTQPGRDTAINWDFAKSAAILKKQFDGGLKGLLRPIFYKLKNVL